MQQQGSTLLKVVSIILIVFGALGIVAGISGLVGGGVVAGSGIADQATGTTLSINNGELSGSDADVAALGITALVLVGVIALISGALDLIIGIVGLKASKENAKHTAAFVLGIIGVVFAVISLIATISAGGDMTTSLASGVVGLILPVLYLVGVNQTRKGVTM